MSIVSRLTAALRSVVLLAAILPYALVLASTPPDPPPAPPATLPEAAPDDAAQTRATGATGDPVQPGANLRLLVEGNRRWCVRSGEQLWPSKPKLQGRRPMTRRRVPTVSTLAYAYYILAQPLHEPQASPLAGEAEVPAAPSPLTGMRSEGEMIQEAYLRDMPPEEVAAGTEEERSTEGEVETPPAAPPADAPPPEAPPPAPFGIDVGLASRPGTIILTQSPVYHTLTRRRVNRPGQPMKVQAAWDNSRSCCSLPTLIDAALPPGRYAIQAHFDALIAGRGWKPVQVARIEGIEVNEGGVTEVRLRVDSQGYVTVNPAGRVVEFPDAAPPQTAPAQTAPTQTAPTQTAPTQTAPAAGPGY